MKRKLMAVLLPLAAMAITGCGKIDRGDNPDTPDEPGQCESVSVSLNKTTLSLGLGKTETLVATVTPASCPVTWSSSNSAVASVSQSGVVSGVSEGTATITVGNATCIVTVSAGVIPPDPTKEIVSLGEVTAPSSIAKGGVLAVTDVTVVVIYNDGTDESVNPERIELDTSVAGEEIEGTVYVGEFSTTFTIEVEDSHEDEDETITPQEAIALMEQAGEGVVVSGLKQVKGICASGTQYDEQYNEYTTGFEGVDNFKLVFKDVNNILNGSLPDGMEIVVEGYLEKYQGKYQLAYLKPEISPTGQKFTPNLISAEVLEHEGVLDSITVSNSHRQFYVGGTFVKETVTAHYSDTTTANVTSKATFTGYNMSSEGDQTVTVSYTEGEITKTTTYSINVAPQGQAVYGTENEPISVTQAITTMTIDCPNNNNFTKQVMYCTGTVKEITDGGVYDPGDNWFQLIVTDGTSDVIIYRVHATDALKDSVKVGEQIKWAGYGKNYNGTLEFVDNGATKCTLLSNDTPTPPDPQKEVVGIEEVVSHPDSVYVGGTIDASKVTLKIKYDDGTFNNVAAESVECDTSAANETATATAHYKTFTKPFTIAVITKPAPTGESTVYTFLNDKTSAQNWKDIGEAGFKKATVCEGDEIITGYSDGSNAYIGGNGGQNEATWNIWNSLKIGKSNEVGQIKIKLDTSASFEKIKMDVIGNRDDGTLTINDITKNVTKKATKDDLNTMQVEFDIEGGVSELALSSKSGSGNFSIIITRIEFVGGGTPTPPDPQKEIDHIAIEGTPSNLSYMVGESYSANGLHIEAYYTDTTHSAISGTITPSKATAEEGDNTISFNASYEGFTAPTVTFNVTVTKAAQTTTATKTVSELAEENDWAISSGNDCAGCYTSFELDSNITVSTSGEPNCGSVWGSSPSNDWRLYRGNGGDLTITAASGYKIVSVKITFNVGNNGTLLNGGTQVSSGTAVQVGDTSITFTVGGGASGKTNGQVRVTAFEVVYQEK